MTIDDEIVNILSRAKKPITADEIFDRSSAEWLGHVLMAIYRLEDSNRIRRAGSVRCQAVFVTANVLDRLAAL